MSQSFSEIISSEVPTLVDFHAEWCGPCKMMRPELDTLKAQMGEKLRIIKIDIDKNPSVANTFKVQSVPTLIVFQSGQVKWRQSGAMTASQIQQVVKPFLV
jgi:thioredoxin 1